MMATENKISDQEESLLLLDVEKDVEKQINKEEHGDIPRAEDNENKTLDKDKLSSLVYVEEDERLTNKEVNSDKQKAENDEISSDTVVGNWVNYCNKNMMATENKIPDQEESLLLLDVEKDVEKQLNKEKHRDIHQADDNENKTLDQDEVLSLVDEILSLADMEEDKRQINKKEHRDIPRAEDNENKTLDKDELSSLVYVEENERWTNKEVNSDKQKAENDEISSDAVLENRVKSCDENMMATENKIPDQEENLSLLGVEKDVENQTNIEEHRDIPRAENSENKTVDQDEVLSLVDMEEEEGRKKKVKQWLDENKKKTSNSSLLGVEDSEKIYKHWDIHKAEDKETKTLDQDEDSSLLDVEDDVKMMSMRMETTRKTGKRFKGHQPHVDKKGKSQVTKLRSGRPFLPYYGSKDKKVHEDKETGCSKEMGSNKVVQFDIPKAENDENAQEKSMKSRDENKVATENETLDEEEDSIAIGYEVQNLNTEYSSSMSDILTRRTKQLFKGLKRRVQINEIVYVSDGSAIPDDGAIEETEEASEDNDTGDRKLINDIFKDSSEEMVLKTFHQLIHRGGNLNYLDRDESDRSILHKAVDKNFLSVVEMLLEDDFDPLCYDVERHIPLRIAIDNRYDEMAALIVSKLDKFVVRRLFGDTESAVNEYHGKSNKFKSKLVKNATDLSQLKTFDEDTVQPMFTIKELVKYGLDQTLMQVFDSFLEEQPNGSYNVHVKLLDIDDDGREPTHAKFNIKCNTSFHKLTKCDKKDALNHPAVWIYAEHKWKNWCRVRFLRYFIMYLLSLFCWTYSVATGVIAPDVSTYNGGLQIFRAFFEVIAYLIAFGISGLEIVQIYRQKMHYFTQPFNLLELFSAIVLLLALPLRYIDHEKCYIAYWCLYAIGYCLWGMKIFKYSIVFNKTGIYAEVIKRIIVQDFFQFSILFAVVNLIFSGTFILFLKADHNLNAHNETSSFHGTMYVGLRTLTEAAAIVEYSGTDGYRTAGTILILVYMFFTIVALRNILIAQVSETYIRTHGDCVKTVRANRAWTIARAERNEWHILPSRTPRRVKHYLGVIEHVDLDAIKKTESTFIEEISEKIEIIEKKQIKDGLEVHTVKTRLGESTQRIEGKIDELSEQLKKVVDLLKEQNK